MVRIVMEDGFTMMEPEAVNCWIVTCKHYEACKNVGILPKANSILAVLGLEWQLPGHGSSYDDCGHWRQRGCLDVEAHFDDIDGVERHGKIYVEFYHRSCYRLVCPICYEKAAGKEAAKIEHKLKYFWKHGKVIHVTVSPSEKDVANIPFEKLREKAYRIAKSRGIRGGVMIWHPFRENLGGRGAALWYYSPHFHIIGVGWVQNVKEGFEKDGWVVKNIQDGGQERSVFKTAMYQLSHCGIDGKHNPVTWFGVCSSTGKNAFRVPPMEKEKHLCPCCGSELVQLRWCGDDEDLPFSWSQKIENHGWWLDPGGWNEKEDPFGRKNYN